MRKSVNIANETRNLIADIKSIKYKGIVVRDAFIINTALTNANRGKLESALEKTSKVGQYQSIRYTLNQEANAILDELMERYSANAIIYEALEDELIKTKQQIEFERIKERFEYSNGEGFLQFSTDFLPAIYSISLSVTEKERVPLYVGQTKSLAQRKTTHLKELLDSKGAYLGIAQKYISLISLHFQIESLIDMSACSDMLSMQNALNGAERDVISRLNPLTQVGMNMSNEDVKIRVVSEAIERLLQDS